MNIEEISEQSSCVMGGKKVLVRLNDQSESSDLVPVFKVYVNGTARPDLEKFIIQPNRERWSITWIIFYSPSQPYISNLPENASIKLTVMVISRVISEICDQQTEIDRLVAGASERCGE